MVEVEDPKTREKTGHLFVCGCFPDVVLSVG
jgi:hypothetical protein